jgi:HEAT repeat protein
MSRKKDEAFAQFLKAMGSCLRGVAPGVLKAAVDVSEDAFVAAASAFLCGFEPNQPGNIQVIQDCLDRLAQSHCASAIAVLTHVAQNAAIGRTKVEAVRRLAGVNLSEDARGLLHELAKDGFNAPHQLPNSPANPEEFRVAAIEAIGKAAKPSTSDVETIRDILSAEVDGRQETRVFATAVEAVHAMGEAFPAKALMAIVGKCHVGLMRLRLLGACSGRTAAALRAHATDMASLLCEALAAFSDEPPLRDRLKALVVRVVGLELVTCLSERYCNDSLGNGRGAVCLAALQAYKKTDHVLTRAYLAFARTPANIHTGAACLEGLGVCAAAGMSDMIVKPLVRQDHPGYLQLVRCGLLLEVLGSVGAVVDKVCDALDAEENIQRRAQSLDRCCEAILAVSLLGEPGASKERGFEWIERGPEWLRQCNPGRMNEIVAALSRCPPDSDGIMRLAARMVSSGPLAGPKAIAEWFAGRSDALGEHFVEAALRAAGDASFSPSQGLPKVCPLAQIEDLIVRQHQPKLRELLPRLVHAEGKLNRFALDLMRRRRIGFQEAAQAILQGGHAPEDAVFVLELLALETDDSSALAIAGATEYNSLDKKAAATVREKAITLACEVLGKRAATPNSSLMKTVLEKLHGRFQDMPAVRLAAYGACGKLADPRSIRPLKDRLRSDKDGKCKEAIGGALKRIGEGLKMALPATHDVSALVRWLGYVGELGDTTLLPSVRPFLSPPHSSADVQVAALQCLEHMGEPSVISQIDEFIAETSPSDSILQAARHAKMTLEGRADLELVEVLSRILPLDSSALEPSIDYAKEFGAFRVKHLAGGLQDAIGQWEAGHWNDYVTKLSGVCEVLSRHLFETRHAAMGLEKGHAAKLACGPYRNRLDISEFRKAFGSIHARMVSIYQLRGEAETAHVEDSDGTGKAGLQKADAELARDEFRKLFGEYASLVAGDQGAQD